MKKIVFLLSVVLLSVLTSFGQKLNGKGEKMIQSLVFTNYVVYAYPYQIDFSYDKEGNLIRLCTTEQGQHVEIKKNGNKIIRQDWIGNKQRDNWWYGYDLDSKGRITTINNYNTTDGIGVLCEKQILKYDDVKNRLIQMNNRTLYQKNKKSDFINADEDLYQNYIYGWEDDNVIENLNTIINGNESKPHVYNNISKIEYGNEINDTNMELQCLINPNFNNLSLGFTNNSLLNLTEWLPCKSKNLPEVIKFIRMMDVEYFRDNNGNLTKIVIYKQAFAGQSRQLAATVDIFYVN